MQAYASRINSVVERPVRWLVAFAHAETGPGAVVTTDIAIPVRSLAHWDVADGAWAIEPGDISLLSEGEAGTYLEGGSRHQS